jgi:hypothetical protein
VSAMMTTTFWRMQSHVSTQILSGSIGNREAIELGEKSPIQRLARAAFAEITPALSPRVTDLASRAAKPARSPLCRLSRVISPTGD